MDPAKFCQTEYNAPGTVACAKLGKWFFARPVESPEFWNASSIAIVIICFLFIPLIYPIMIPRIIPKKYSRIITSIIIIEDVKIASLLVPITPATIRQITIDDIPGR